MNRKYKLVAVLLTVAGIFFIAHLGMTAPQNETIPNDRIPVTFVAAVDGDTFKVSFDGKEEKVRLLLVDTPESVKPGTPVEPFAKEASEFTLSQLKKGNLFLELDVSERDKYGRLLAYVWVGDNMLNEVLLEKGYARVAYIYPPNVKYVDQFRQIQAKAQKSGIGIWSIENYVQEDGFNMAVVKHSSRVAVGYYKDCAAARAAGTTPIYEGEPGYSRKLDRDDNGIACEK